MMRKIPIDGKIIFISTVDCGYGQNLARILATNGAIVLGGCVDPTAESVSNLRDYSIYLVKFETSSDEKIDEGIGRVKLRHGFAFYSDRINYQYGMVCIIWSLRYGRYGPFGHIGYGQYYMVLAIFYVFYNI